MEHPSVHAPSADNTWLGWLRPIPQAPRLGVNQVQSTKEHPRRCDSTRFDNSILFDPFFGLGYLSRDAFGRDAAAGFRISGRAYTDAIFAGLRRFN